VSTTADAVQEAGPAMRRRPGGLLTVAIWAWSLVLLAGYALSRASAWLWAGDLATFFLPHLGLMAAVTTVFAWLLGRRLPALLAGLAALAVASALLLPERSAIPPAGPSVPLRVMSYNLFYGSHDLVGLRALLDSEKPDVVALQEATAHWREGLAEFAGSYPHQSHLIDGRRHHLVLMSRYPIMRLDWYRALPKPQLEIPNPAGLQAVIEVEGQAVEVFAAHPPTPRTLAAWQTRNAYLELLTGRIKEVDSHRPLIVLGDFNTSPWSYWGRLLVDGTGLRDVALWGWPKATRIFGRAMFGDWLGTTVDRILVSRGVGVSDFRVRPSTSSDHRPIIADLRISRPGTSAMEKAAVR
jgi:endonuclease/exonuclease/phosphatase (EEP) superfamily protein YafD